MVSQISVSFLIVFIVIQWKIAGLEAPKLFVLAERLGDLSKAKALWISRGVESGEEDGGISR